MIAGVATEAVPIALSTKGARPRRTLPVAPEFRSARHPIQNVVMLITEECNLRCDYCYIRKQPRTMTEGIAERSVAFLFEQAPPAPTGLSITFFGGEPLLEPGLIELIHASATARAAADGDRPISFSMTTNATLLSAANVEMIERLGISVRLSLDGIGDAHDRHRRTRAGKGSFPLIQRHLERAAGLPSVSVRLTVSPETASELPASIAWLGERGFRSISFSPVIEADWTEDDLAHLYLSLKELYRMQAERPGVRINSIARTRPALESSGERWGCGAARTFVAIDAEGYLYPCHRFVGYFQNGPQQRIGHVDHGFDVGAREHYIVANHSSSHVGCGHGLFPEDLAPQEHRCGNCSLLGVCGSNCMAVNEHMTGDPTRPPSINRVLAQIEAAANLQSAAGLDDPLVPDPCTARV
ncbi:MAG: uncharacterized protein QOE93_2358 [Actinomycetota bacterium]|jgi:uncharacterized protein|nr:uncharacterized protein [Actinomycetota bacterium]